MRLRFVVPENVDEPTGGNVYDRAAAQALRRAGDEVELLRCAPDDLAAVVATAWPGPTLVDGLLAARLPAAVASGPCAVLVHMPLNWEGGGTPEEADRLDALERDALRAATAVIAPSRWAAHFLTKHHRLEHVAVAVPGVEPAALVEGSDPPLIVHVAALLPHKDQLSVVRALGQVADLPWRARLAGDATRDPAYAAAVTEAIAANGLSSRVELTGVLPRDLAWAGADLALLPSLAETYGLVVTEALARGIPAVVSAGGPAEALGNVLQGRQPGALVAPADTDQLAQVLRHWLTDADYRAELRERVLIRRAQLPTWDDTAAQLRQALSPAGS